MYSLPSATFILIIIISSFYVVLLSVVVETDDGTGNENLVLVHVLFRHGDRTPELSEIYPNDPYANYTYSQGYGKLTFKGKQKEYLLGKTLRNRYKNFLGDFDDVILYAQSTNYDRTKISCELVIAGLFPPSKHQEIEEGLSWQPILYTFDRREIDYLLEDPRYNCPKYNKYYENYIQSPEYKLYNVKYNNFYEYLTLSTGWHINGPKKVYDMYFALASEESLGLETPTWAKDIWPANISVAAADEYLVSIATPDMKRLTGGRLLKKIFDDTVSKITNMDSNNKKIYLYSAHENNIAVQLLLLNIFYPHVPPFGSYIIYEVHKINGIYGFKFYYQDYTNNGELKLAKLPQCEFFCPIEQFLKLVEDYFPSTGDSCEDNKEI